MESERVMTEKIAKLAEAVRQKMQSLKNDLAEQKEVIERQVAPLKEPLDTIVAKISPKRIKTEQVETPATGDTEDEKVEKHVQVEPEKEPEEEPKKIFSATEFHELAQGKNSDRVYGPRFDGSKYWIGDTQVRLGKKYLRIGDFKYRYTEGLIQLLTRNKPKNYDQDDLDSYKSILEQTNAHKKTFSGDKPINANRGHKYSKVIAPLFGRGLELEETESYSNNIIDMLYRLELLWNSEEAGNTHTDEINGIINRLRYLGVIY